MTTKARCTAIQHNNKKPDFECKLDATAHTIHVDPSTGEKWGTGKYPRGWNRRWSKKKYANPKLHRHAKATGR